MTSEKFILRERKILGPQIPMTLGFTELGVRLTDLPLWYQNIAIGLLELGHDPDTVLKLLFLGKPGRPRKEAGTKKPRGAPRKPTIRPEWIDAVKREHGLSGRGSDKRAIEILLQEAIEMSAHKSSRGMRQDKRRRLVLYFQKQLSSVRKAADNSKKSAKILP